MIYWRDLKISLSILASIILNVLLWIFIYRKIKMPPPLILHYDVYFGVDKVGSAADIYALPISGLLLIAINTFVSYFFYLKDRFVSYLLVVFLPVMQIILAVSGVLIYLANIIEY